MEPMNQFLSSHRQEFKTFVDAICGISPDRAGSSIPPSYATPITILGRLPGTSREGFPSLPYLIDQARECAGLVNLWLEARYDVEPGTSTSDELRRFDTLCEQSQQKTKYCLSLAEQNQRTNGAMEPNWEELAQQIGRKSRIRSENGRLGLGTHITDGSLYTSDSSTSSLEDGYFSRNTPLQDARSIAATIGQSEGQGIDDDRQSSGGETNTPPVSSPAVWDPGVHGDEETMSTQAIKDDDEDSFEQLAPNTLGSSMYSLGTNPSNKLVKSQQDSGHRSKHDKVAKSTYSLDPVRHSERGSGSKSSTPSRTSAGGYRDRVPSGSVGKGMYRLETSTRGDRKSPASRDGAGGILRGDSWNLFKKKGRE